MFQYKCLNPISQTGLGLFGDEYKQTEELKDADAVLVRSAKMHDMETSGECQSHRSCRCRCQQHSG